MILTIIRFPFCCVMEIAFAVSSSEHVDQLINLRIDKEEVEPFFVLLSVRRLELYSLHFVCSFEFFLLSTNLHLSCPVESHLLLFNPAADDHDRWDE